MAEQPSKLAATSELAARIDSDPSQIAGVRRRAEELAAGNGFDEESVGAIGLCVNEALANIIRHAYQCAHNRPIEIKASVHDDLFDVHIRDWGSGVVPHIKKEKATHELSKPGGLGLPCMSKMMDLVKFIPQSDGMLLHMSKRRR